MSYCTYLTVYKGNKLPPFYIGSTSIENISNGYKGSVRSAKYKEIWISETKDNPELFKTKIISIHMHRKDALEKENQLQKKLNVISNNLYVNMAYATGCFGSMSKESIEKMAKTKKANGKIVGEKVSKTRNDPIWKATIGKMAAEKLSKTKRDPARAKIESEMYKKLSERFNDPKWKETVGKEWRKKISESVKKTQSDLKWKETKGVQQKENFKKTINDTKWKETVGKEANKKRSIQVSKTKTEPGWKEKNSTKCKICNSLYMNNVLSRHMIKCNRDKG